MTRQGSTACLALPFDLVPVLCRHVISSVVPAQGIRRSTLRLGTVHSIQTFYTRRPSVLPLEIPVLPSFSPSPDNRTSQRYPFTFDICGLVFI
jgi:hypothetical protein